MDYFSENLELNDIETKTIKRNSELFMGDIIELREMLQKINDFNFDIFKFDEVCRKNSLFYYSFELFGKYELFLNINEIKFKNFIYSIRDGYSRNNSYHNDLHATDVLQTSVAIFENGNLCQVKNLKFISIDFYFFSTI